MISNYSAISILLAKSSAGIIFGYWFVGDGLLRINV